MAKNKKNDEWKVFGGVAVLTLIIYIVFFTRLLEGFTHEEITTPAPECTFWEIFSKAVNDYLYAEVTTEEPIETSTEAPL